MNNYNKLFFFVIKIKYIFQIQTGVDLSERLLDVDDVNCCGTCEVEYVVAGILGTLNDDDTKLCSCAEPIKFVPI